MESITYTTLPGWYDTILNASIPYMGCKGNYLFLYKCGHTYLGSSGNWKKKPNKETCPDCVEKIKQLNKPVKRLPRLSEYITTLVTPKGKQLKFTQKQLYRIRKWFNMISIPRLINGQLRSHRGWYNNVDDYIDDHRLFIIYDRDNEYSIRKKDLKPFLYKYSSSPNVNNFLVVYGTNRHIYGLFSNREARDEHYKHIEKCYVFYDQFNTYEVMGKDLSKFGVESGYDPTSSGQLSYLIKGQIPQVKGLFIDKNLRDEFYANRPEDDVCLTLNPEGYKGAVGRYYFRNKNCGHVYRKSLSRYRADKLHCPICGVTKQERVLMDILDELGVNYTNNDWEPLRNRELDFFIPTHNLAIEINGLAYHSIPNCLKESPDKNKHQNKYMNCHEVGISLLQFTDIEVLTKIELIKSIISYRIKHSNIIKIDARKCKIMDIDIQTASSFLEENHLRGFIEAPLKCGLYYKDELVYVMLLNEEGKILRHCSKTFTGVRGGFTKLLKYAIIENKLPSVSVVSDNVFSNGSVYEVCGFNYEEQPINYSYIKGFQITMPELYDINIDPSFIIEPNKDINELLMLNKYSKYYDAGSKLWVRNV